MTPSLVIELNETVNCVWDKNQNLYHGDSILVYLYCTRDERLPRRITATVLPFYETQGAAAAGANSANWLPWPPLLTAWCFYFIRGLLGSDLSRDTGYPERGFSWFSSDTPSECLGTTKIKPRSFPSNLSVVIILHARYWQGRKVTHNSRPRHSFKRLVAGFPPLRSGVRNRT
jgi:hypothetical protein